MERDESDEEAEAAPRLILPSPPPTVEEFNRMFTAHPLALAAFGAPAYMLDVYRAGRSSARFPIAPDGTIPNSKIRQHYGAFVDAVTRTDGSKKMLQATDDKDRFALLMDDYMNRIAEQEEARASQLLEKKGEEKEKVEVEVVSRPVLPPVEVSANAGKGKRKKKGVSKQGDKSDAMKKGNFDRFARITAPVPPGIPGIPVVNEAVTTAEEPGPVDISGPDAVLKGSSSTMVESCEDMSKKTRPVKEKKQKRAKKQGPSSAQEMRIREVPMEELILLKEIVAEAWFTIKDVQIEKHAVVSALVALMAESAHAVKHDSMCRRLLQIKELLGLEQDIRDEVIDSLVQQLGELEHSLRMELLGKTDTPKDTSDALKRSIFKKMENDVKVLAHLGYDIAKYLQLFDPLKKSLYGKEESEAQEADAPVSDQKIKNDEIEIELEIESDEPETEVEESLKEEHVAPKSENPSPQESTPTISQVMIPQESLPHEELRVAAAIAATDNVVIVEDNGAASPVDSDIGMSLPSSASHMRHPPVDPSDRTDNILRFPSDSALGTEVDSTASNRSDVLEEIISINPTLEVLQEESTAVLPVVSDESKNVKSASEGSHPASKSSFVDEEFVPGMDDVLFSADSRKYVPPPQRSVTLVDPIATSSRENQELTQKPSESLTRFSQDDQLPAKSSGSNLRALNLVLSREHSLTTMTKKEEKENATLTGNANIRQSAVSFAEPLIRRSPNPETLTAGAGAGAGAGAPAVRREVTMVGGVETVRGSPQLRHIVRPSHIPPRDWSRLSAGRIRSNTISNVEPKYQPNGRPFLPDIGDNSYIRPEHCKYEQLVRRGLHKPGISISRHLDRYDLLDTISRGYTISAPPSTFSQYPRSSAMHSSVY